MECLLHYMGTMEQLRQSRERTRFTAVGDVGDLIAARAGMLSVAERRVAEVVLGSPQTVAFGTVAELAAAAGAGVATVARLAAKLGFEGYSDLQAAVRDDLARQLRPAAERIRTTPGADALSQHRAVEAANVEATLDAVDPVVLAGVVERLADRGRTVAVIAADASAGVATQFVSEVAALRPGVVSIEGNAVAVARTVALLESGDTLVAFDLRRYDRWLIDTVRRASERGVWLVALTDSRLSPLAIDAHAVFTVSAGAVGPFDSHVGTLALCNVLVAGVAERLRTEAAARLERIEAAWRAAGALTDG